MLCCVVLCLPPPAFSVFCIVYMALTTRITRLLGVKHPIILPGMSWISTPPLVAAVCNAGGLGILATGPLSPQETRESIEMIRKLAPGKKFGIGCTLLMPGAKENAEVALEMEVPVINISLGKGDWICKRAKEYGGKVIVTVVNEKHALSAREFGADALMVTGHEAAAHGGDVTTLCLVNSLSKKTDLPIIAAGGIGDGRGLAAMLAIGILHLSSTYYNHHLHASFSMFVLFGCHIMGGVLMLTYVVIFAHSSMCLYF